MLLGHAFSLPDYPDAGAKRNKKIISFHMRWVYKWADAIRKLIIKYVYSKRLSHPVIFLLLKTTLFVFCSH